VLHTLYGRLALARRAWYERPGARRRLARPVVSVGNLSVGGTGKTPLVAALARWLVAAGQRPAILSRGYARRVTSRDPLVVSDGQRVHADASHAGDEPLMLARLVPGAVVVVSADRHAAGVVAERTLGATVHVLDDGFQHLPLARDLDIVVTRAGALATDAVLPKGRLREPIAALARAQFLVVVGASDEAAQAEARAYGVPVGLGAARRLEAPIAVHGPAPDRTRPVVVMAGIGQPAQFVDALAADGWIVADACFYRDHYWYTDDDLAAVAVRVRASRAWGIATTDKDAVRIERLGPPPVPVARWPLVLELPRWDVLAASIGRLLGHAA
jgi:tetraacyldisaccharide 4'-kinase